MFGLALKSHFEVLGSIELGSEMKCVLLFAEKYRNHK